MTEGETATNGQTAAAAAANEGDKDTKDKDKDTDTDTKDKDTKDKDTKDKDTKDKDTKDKDKDTKDKDTKDKDTKDKDTKDKDTKDKDPKDQEEMAAKVLLQIQYYFGDYNLPRDKFLQQEIKTDEGWIPLDTMLKFKRLANICSDKAVIATTLKDSKDTFMEVDESGEKIRRSPDHPLPEQSEESLKEEVLKRTVYCKGFPKDGSTTLDKLLEYFKQYGPYETVLMRHFFNKEEKKQGFKGSVLVVFNTEEKAKEFKELPQVTYEESNQLLRKWHADYIEEKKQEIEERKARKEERKKVAAEKETLESINDIDLPRGTFLHFSGLPDGGESSREDVKAALGEEAERCAWVDYNRGKTEGFLRFKEENTNKEICEKLGGKIKVNDVEVELRMVEGEEETEQLQKMKEARSRARINNSVHKKRRGGGRGGGHFKRRRT